MRTVGHENFQASIHDDYQWAVGVGENVLCGEIVKEC